MVTIPEAFWLNEVSFMYPILETPFPRPGVSQTLDFTGFNEMFSRLHATRFELNIHL